MPFSPPATSPRGGVHPPVRCSDEVADALAGGAPVVALESTIIAHGLPRPANLTVAREFEQIVRDIGAVPATIAVVDGEARIGLGDDDLQRVAADESIRKLGMRDLPLALATGGLGATTVSATAYLASLAGIRVFATGGIGGVHRGWAQSWDESADLGVLGSRRITVVCAGVKSILDVPATLQRLETLNVTVVGFGCDEFPGFYLRSSGLPVDWRLDDVAAVAEVMHRQDELGSGTALLIGNPVPADEQLDPVLHDRVLAEALAAAAAQGVDGQAITPFLLGHLVEATDGASLRANLAAVRGNIRVAAEIAVAFAADARVAGPAPDLTTTGASA